MATITIRNVSDSDYQRLKQDAHANHRSLEAEARFRIVGQRMSRQEVIDTLRAARLSSGPDYEGSVALIRAIRDEE